MKPTQYPTYITEEGFINFWSDYLKNHQWENDEDLSLYIHYPWCRKVCNFCVFGALTLGQSKGIKEKYENATIRLISSIGSALKESNRIPTDIAFGGGTASLWGRNYMEQIPSAIPHYMEIPLRKTEAHPIDLSDVQIKFYADVMKFNQVSIGVQSFDKSAIEKQGRIYVNPPEIERSVRHLQKHGILVNIDLIAMLNGDDQNNWELFEKDLELAAGVIKPDSITVYPNDKSSSYYESSVKLRRILGDFIGKFHEYDINNSDALSAEMIDVIKYADTPYLLHNSRYSSFYSSIITYKQNTPRNPNIIGIGGIESMPAFSSTAEMHAMSGTYISWDDEFVYLKRTNDIFDYLKITDVDLLKRNEVMVGHQTIATVED